MPGKYSLSTQIASTTGASPIENGEGGNVSKYRLSTQIASKAGASPIETRRKRLGFNLGTIMLGQSKCKI
jgi:hypothetical protein